MVYSLAKHGTVGHGANHRLLSDFYLLPSSPHSLQLLHAGFLFLLQSACSFPETDLHVLFFLLGSCHACLLAHLRASPLFQEVMLPPSHCLSRPWHVFFLAMLFSEIIRFPLIDSLTRKKLQEGGLKGPHALCSGQRTMWTLVRESIQESSAELPLLFLHWVSAFFSSVGSAHGPGRGESLAGLCADRSACLTQQFHLRCDLGSLLPRSAGGADRTQWTEAPRGRLQFRMKRILEQS